MDGHERRLLLKLSFLLRGENLKMEIVRAKKRDGRRENDALRPDFPVTRKKEERLINEVAFPGAMMSFVPGPSAAT